MSLESSDIIILIDESGSMKRLGDEPLEALNSFISDQQKSASVGSKLTIWKFNNKVTTVIDKVLLTNVNQLTEFHPSGMTSLYDAIGRSINDHASSRNVTCVILTDGYNNSSVEFNSEMIKQLVTERENDYGWIFHFLGANQDSFTSGKNIGIRRCSTFSPTQGSIDNITAILRNTSVEITRDRLLRDSSSFSRPPPPPPTSPYLMPLLTRQSSAYY
jgi:hypothetical protein